MSREFKPEVKVTFANGASFNLAEFELVDEPNAPYDPPQVAVQSFPGTYSEVIDCMEANKCMPLFESGAWHAIDSRKIVKLTVQLAKNPQSSSWLPKGAQTFNGETFPAFGFLNSEMSDASVFLSVSATTSDGKSYSGRLPDNKHIAGLNIGNIRISGYTRQLGKETPIMVDLNRLQELQCAGHVCQVKYFTQRSTETGAEFRVREDGLRQAEIHRTKVIGGAEDSSLISLTTAERGMVRLPLMAARYQYATTDQFYETDTHEFNNTLSIAVTGPTSRKKVKSHGVFDDVEMGAIPIEVRTRSGEAARVYFSNRKSIRGWTSNGKLIYTRVVGYSGQPIVRTIDILGASGR